MQTTLLVLAACLAVVLGGGGGGGTTQCNSGQYKSGSSCHSCSAGRFMDSNNHENTSCKPCSAGRYQGSSGASSCSNCPCGKSSGSTASSCSNCGNGYYSSSGGGCATCPAGRAGSSSCNSCPSCASGKYASAGWSGCVNCPSGKYQASGGQSSCSSCPSGKFQSGSGKTRCDSCSAGKYESSSGQSSCRFSAPAGRYTSNGASGVTGDCAKGRYAAVTGSTSSSCQGPCAAGYYCPNTGSTTATPSATRCAAGRWGSTGQTASTCSGACSAGYYCPVGSTSSTQNACGSGLSSGQAGYYCPAGAGGRSTVSSGYYSTPESASVNHRTGQSQCPAGYFCTAGVRSKCPAGRFADSPGVSNAQCEGACEAGFYCPTGSSSARQVACGGAGLYCPAGSSSPVSVSANHYTTPEDVPEDRRSGQALCSEQFKCEGGRRELFLAWTDEFCGEGGSGEMHFSEGVPADQVLGTLAVNNRVPGSPPVTYTVSSAKPGGCLVDGTFHADASGTLRTGGAPYDHESCEFYSVTVTAFANGAPSPTCSLVVWNDDVNEAPAMGALPAVTGVKEDVEVGAPIGSTVTVVDPDFGQAANMKFALEEGAPHFAVSSCSGQLEVAADLAPGVYPITLTATDPGGLTTSRSSTVTVVAVNHAPAFTQAAYTLSVAENPSLKAPVGSVAATDPDGNTLTFALAFNDQGAFAIDAATGAISVLKPSLFDFEDPGVAPAPMTVTVTDGLATDTATVAVTVTNANEAPTVSGPLDVVTLPESTAVGADVGDALASSDPDGDALSWSVTGGTGSALFTVTPTGQLRLAAPLNFDAGDRDFTVTVTVSDGALTASAAVAVEVLPVNEAPTAADVALTVSEAAATPAVLAPAVAASDPDGDSLFFAVTGVSPAGASASFGIDGATGSLRVVGDLNHEATPSFDVEVTVSDNGNPAASTVVTATVSVADANDPPAIVPSQVFSVSEAAASGDVVGAIAFAEEDVGDSVAFAATPPVAGLAVAADGTITVDGGLDFEATPDGRLVVNVTATDAGGATDTATVLVQVLDANDMPAVPPQQRSVAAGTLSGTPFDVPVMGVDADADDQVLSYVLLSSSTGGGLGGGGGPIPVPSVTGVAIDHTSGQLRVEDAAAAAAAFAQGPILLAVRATDAAGAEAEGSVQVVQVGGGAAAPDAPDAAVFVPEDKTAGFFVADLAAADPNGDAVAYSLLFADPLSGFGQFAVSPAGTVTLTDQELDFESGAEFRLVFAASDGVMANPIHLSVTIVDVSEPPTFTPPHPTLSIAEMGSGAVGTVAAADTDVGATITWSMAATTVGGAPLPFVIDAGTGVVSTAPGAALDHETTPTYEVEVTIRDDTQLSATTTLTIEVTNVNEAPSVADVDAGPVPEDATPGTVVAVVPATDIDAGSVLTHAVVSGDPDAQFRFVGSSLVTAKALDYELVPAYTLTVVVSDGALTDTATVNVAVGDTNDLVVTGLSDGAVHPNTAGGDDVVFAGRNFGRVDGTAIDVTATYISENDDEPYTTTCAITVPYSEITCPTAPGTGTGLVWTLTVGTHSVVAAGIETRYAAPTLSTVDGDSGLPTAGNATVVLRGANFGPAGTGALVSYGPTADLASASGTRYLASGCVVTEADVAVSCRSVAGLGTELFWRLTIDGQGSGLSPDAGAYAPPEIHAVVAPEEEGGLLGTRGGQTVAVTGANFGVGPVVDASYGPYAASCAVVAPHTGLECTTAAGVGAGHTWTVTVGGQTSPPSTDATSYRPPVVVEVSGAGAQDASTFGGQPVLVSGDQFGPAQTPVDVVFGRPEGSPDYASGGSFGGVLHYSMACVVTVPHTEVACTTPPGTGKDHHWRATVAGQDSNVLDAGTSYRPPVVSGYSGAGAVDAGTPGGEVIVLHGTEFGPEGRPVRAVTYGRDGHEFTATGCAQTTDWAACRAAAAASGASAVTCPQTITCATAPGAGANLFYIVTIDGIGSVHEMTNYGAPQVLGFVGADGVAVDALSTEGGQNVTLLGLNFGTPQFFEGVQYGPAGSGSRPDCVVDSHTAITCTTLPGTGAARWTVAVAGQESLPSEAVTRYAPPEVVDTIPASTSTRGGYTMQIQGRNFGLSVQGVEVYVVFESGTTPDKGGEQAGTGSDLEPVLVWPPGTDRLLVNLVVPAGQPLPDAAELEDLTDGFGGGDDDGPSTEPGGGAFDPVGGIFRRRQLATVVPWDTLFITVPEGFGADRSVAIVVNNAVSNTATFTYAAPTIASIDVVEGDLRGHSRVIVNGVGFCASQDCGTVTVDDEAVSLVVSWTHEQVVFETDKQGGAAAIIVGDRVSDVVEFNFFSPVITLASRLALQTRTYPTAGGIVLEFLGAYIGLQSVNVTVGVNPCPLLGVEEVVDPELEDEDDILYNVTCLLPPGVGANQQVVVYRFAQASPANNPDLTGFLSYAAPVLGGIRVGDALANASAAVLPSAPSPFGGTEWTFPTVGGVYTLEGTDFGAGGNGTTLELTFGTATLTVLRQTHTACVVLVPPGAGSTRILGGIVGGQRLQAELYVRYEDPAVATIYPDHGPTAGGTTITISGSNFGNVVPEVTIGGAPCAVSPLFLAAPAHDTIVCTAPAGQGLNRRVVVTVAGLASGDTPAAWDYDRPVLASHTPSHSPTSGGGNHTLTGANFGFSGSLSLFTEEERLCDADTQCTMTVDVPPGAIVSWNHTAIVYTVPAGHSDDLVPRVVVDGLASQETTASDPHLAFEYDVPTLEWLTPRNAPTGGGVALDIYGVSLGDSVDEAFGARVSVDGKPCLRPTTPDDPLPSASETLSLVTDPHAAVQCIIPRGIGANRTVSVTVGAGRQRAATNTLLFSYDPPEVWDLVPNVPDALGDSVTVVGKNFGYEETPVDMVISNLTCVTSWLGDNRLECSSTPADVAGPKNLTLTVANQTTVFTAASRRYESECKTDYWGLEGEECLACPVGGVCPGSDAPMHSDSGFWLSLVEGSDENCEGGAARAHRADCPYLLACLPLDSCTGNNTCAVGYTADRCAECIKGEYYRLGGECVKCPDNPWLIVALFVAAVLALAIGGYFLSRKSVHLAFLSIGVDYFQVLAMFRRSRIEWPPTIKTIFAYMSAFNLNLDIAAPECAVPDVSYADKWKFAMALPIIAAVCFALFFLTTVLWKKFIICRSVGATSHLPTLINTSIVGFYFLYLYLSRLVMDVFNCQATTPPDGHTYMLEAFVRCWEPGGVHMGLVPLALGALVVYVIGFPVFIWRKLSANRDLVQTDQVLRALSVPETTQRYKQVFIFRRKFHKMYYHFKPDHHMWILAILMRKLGVAFTSLVFRRTPSFQLAMLLLVLFAAYVVQVKVAPYMSQSDRKGVVALWAKHPKAGTNPTYVTIASIVARETNTSVGAHKVRSLDSAEANRAATERAMASRAATFLWDYNVVEATLLACSILVCLAGIMFESGRFDDTAFNSERDAITWAVLLIIFLSIAYFLTVFISEVVITINPDACTRSEKSLARLKAKRTERNRAMAKYADVALGGVFNMEGGQAMLADANSRLGGQTHTVSENPLLHKIAEVKTQEVAAASRIDQRRRNRATDKGRTKFSFAPTIAAPSAEGDERLDEMSQFRSGGIRAGRGGRGLRRQRSNRRSLATVKRTGSGRSLTSTTSPQASPGLPATPEAAE